MNEITNILIMALPVIFAITLHEAAHAWTANYFGDPTARQLGRISANPMVHIDIMGTLIVPAALYLMTNGQFVFGFAKPVPVDFSKLRNPKKQMGFVAFAGPAANLAMAWAWAVFGDLLGSAGIDEVFFLKMAQGGVLVNLIMFAFNLFPLPPLDGGRVLVALLPRHLAFKVSRIEPFGFFIVMLLLVTHLIDFWIIPMYALGQGFVHLLTAPFSFFAN